jgi:hypothetical protein
MKNYKGTIILFVVLFVLTLISGVYVTDVYMGINESTITVSP